MNSKIEFIILISQWLNHIRVVIHGGLYITAALNAVVLVQM